MTRFVFYRPCCHNSRHGLGRTARQSRIGHYFIRTRAERALSVLVKYEWNPVWQEKWGLSPGDAEKCADFDPTLCWDLHPYSVMVGRHRRIPQMSSSFGRGVTGHRTCEDLGTHTGPDSGKAFITCQTWRCSCKATWFCHTRSVPTVRVHHLSMWCKTGFKA